MSELIAMEDEDYKEVFDFNSPETVIFEVVVNTPEEYGPYTWKQCSIETVSIIGRANEDVTGAASYEMSYGGFLDYRIEEQLLCPGEGWWTIEDVTGYYHRGEWGFTDDDFELYMDDCRPATPEEIALA